MTLQELITDLKAAGANDNTLHLALNCYELGQRDEREAVLQMSVEHWFKTQADYDDAIRARGTACK
jgi:Flp pilus assembly CpaE family ATPase